MFKCLVPSALVIACVTAGASAQLLHSWSASSTDDGNPIPNFRNTWVTNVSNGASQSLATLTGRALAADNASGRLFSSGGNALSTFVVQGDQLVLVADSVRVVDMFGIRAESGQIQSLGFAGGLLYASVAQSGGLGIPAGLYAIDPTTARATLIAASSKLPFALFPGMDYNADDGLMYAVTESIPQQIVRFDLKSFTFDTVAEVPISAYNGVTGVSFVGLGVGGGKVYLTHGLNSGYGTVPIAVFDLATRTFGQGLPSPTRSAENRLYSGGATYFPAGLRLDPYPGPPSTPVVTARNALEGQVLLTWGSNSERDFSFYRVYRSTNNVDFIALATTTSTSYTDINLSPGATLFYQVTAVDQSGLESAPSSTARITLPGGPAPFIAVSSIEPSVVTDSRGRSRARVRVVILDQDGLPVPSAVVSVQFTGSLNETFSGVTNSSGVATITTIGRVTGVPTFQACVLSVSGSRPYDPSRNAETCDSR
jgi:hypothetical protein